jgi:hypothetical protein
LDDPLADNRLFSAEMSAEQASSFGILEWLALLKTICHVFMSEIVLVC